MTDLVKYDEDTFMKLEKQFADIPFGNSAFQIRNFVLADQMTPARAYRSIGINILGIVDALREHLYSLKKTEIKLARKRAKLEESEDEYERQLLDLKIEKLCYSERGLLKLVGDAQAEFDVYYSELQKYPRFSRKKFENQEQAHFHMNLHRQQENKDGATESLHNMQIDAPMLDYILEHKSFLEEIQRQIKKGAPSATQLIEASGENRQ